MKKDANEAICSVVETLQNIDQLKPEQEQALLSFVGGQDVVALLPTGFGKPSGTLTRRPTKLLATALFPRTAKGTFLKQFCTSRLDTRSCTCGQDLVSSRDVLHASRRCWASRIPWWSRTS